MHGVPVGERFLRLASPQRPGNLGQPLGRAIDYQQPPARCVSVSEDGTVQVHRPQADLLVHGEVACWTEPEAADGSRWRLTHASIQRAVKTGWTAEHIIDSLAQRVQHGLPPWSSWIRAWAGVQTLPTAVAMASDLILQIASEEVSTALRHGAGSALTTNTL